MGHSTASCESLRREKIKDNWRAAPIKKETAFEAEILMVTVANSLGGPAVGRDPTRKRRNNTLEFGRGDPTPDNYQGTEPLIISGSVGRTKIHRIYVDGGSSVNIIYEHCLLKLPTEVKGFVRPTPSSLTVIGFAGEPVRPEGRISLPFTLEDYAEDRRKTILADFVIIRAESPYNMLLGRTGIWQLQAVASTVHGLLKFPTDEGIITLRSTATRPQERSNTARHDHGIQKSDSPTLEKGSIIVNPRYIDQAVRVGKDLPPNLRIGLTTLLKEHANVFAWEPRHDRGPSKHRRAPAER